MVKNKQLSTGSVSFVSHYVLIQETKVYWFVQNSSRGTDVLLNANGDSSSIKAFTLFIGSGSILVLVVAGYIHHRCWWRRVLLQCVQGGLLCKEAGEETRKCCLLHIASFLPSIEAISVFDLNEFFQCLMGSFYQILHVQLIANDILSNKMQGSGHKKVTSATNKYTLIFSLFASQP